MKADATKSRGRLDSSPIAGESLQVHLRFAVTPPIKDAGSAELYEEHFRCLFSEVDIAFPGAPMPSTQGSSPKYCALR
jgi:hypothetical protein